MKETEHFLAIFNGFLIILFGGAASGFHRKEKDVKFNPKERNRLLQVRNRRAAEVILEKLLKFLQMKESLLRVRLFLPPVQFEKFSALGKWFREARN